MKSAKSQDMQSHGHLDASKRLLLRSAGALAAGVGMWPSDAASSPVQTSGKAVSKAIDLSHRVTASQLDTLVAQAFPRFNQPVILPSFDATRLGARYDVNLHRIHTYISVPETRERVLISGLLAVPVRAPGPIPVVSWQHGTILSYDQVPSNMLLLREPGYQMTDSKDSLETLFNVHRFAGQGYAVIAADYVGKGPARRGRGEGYAVKAVTVRTCVSMLDIGLGALTALGFTPGQLFLNGWSQGALNTQWLHQALRSAGRPVAGTAVQSPFNDLSQAWRFWSGVQTFPNPVGVSHYPALPDWISLCMIVALGSYQLHYKLDGLLNSAIRPEYRDLAQKFWSDYSLDFDPHKAFPTGLDLLVPGFFERFTDVRNSAFLRHMANNTSTYWNYDAPIRFHFGLADEAIHPAMVGRALAAGGPNAQGVPIAGASHRGTFLASLYGDSASLGGQDNVLGWFNARNR